MEVSAAQSEFVSLLQRMDSSSSLNGFLKWIKTNWFSADVVEEPESTVVVNGVEAEELLERIAADLRQQLPLEAQLPSENIMYPTIGNNSDCNPSTTINIDSFLYDDKLVDTLCDEGKLPKSYCLACGSRNIKPLTFISHSASRENLAHIFMQLLPDLSGKQLVDIGSRFGAVLFGAFAYSQAIGITGIEINPDLCALSSSMLKKYNMQSRVRVLEGDVRLYGEVVSTADVIVMNNVFEFFAPTSVQRDLWLSLRGWIKTGALILTSPSLAESLKHLDTGIRLEEWVETLPSEPPAFATDSDDVELNSSGHSIPDMDLVHLYRVL